MTVQLKTAPDIAIRINGDERTIGAATTLAGLLRSLDLDPRMVVVERNREILRDRDRFDDVMLADGDVLEVVHFVGGG